MSERRWETRVHHWVVWVRVITVWAKGLQDVFACDFGLVLFPINAVWVFWKRTTSRWMKAESVSVSSGSNVSEIHRLIGECCIGEVIIITLYHWASINTSCSFRTCRQVIQRLGCVRSLVTIHQLVRRDLGDELLLFSDEVDLRRLLLVGTIAIVEWKSILTTHGHIELWLLWALRQIRGERIEICLVKELLRQKVLILLSVGKRLNIDSLSLDLRILTSSSSSWIASLVTRNRCKRLTRHARISMFDWWNQQSILLLHFFTAILLIPSLVVGSFSLYNVSRISLKTYFIRVFPLLSSLTGLSLSISICTRWWSSTCRCCRMPIQIRVTFIT